MRRALAWIALVVLLPYAFRVPLLVHAQEGTDDTRADTLSSDCIAYYNQGDMTGALSACQSALALYRQAEDRENEAVILNNIGHIYEGLFEHQLALEHLQQAASLWEILGNKSSQAGALSSMGAVYHYMGSYQNALSSCQKALGLAKETEDKLKEAMALLWIGAIHRAVSDYEQALSYYQQALALFRYLEDRQGEASALATIGEVHRDRAEYEQALAYHLQVLEIRQDIGPATEMASALNDIGGDYRAMLKYDEALVYHQKALDLFRESRDRLMEGHALHNIGWAYHGAKDYGNALAYYEQALAIRREIGQRSAEAVTLGNMATVYDVLGQPDQAIEYAIQGIAVIESVQGELKAESLQSTFAADKARKYHYLVHLLLEQGRQTEAFNYAEQGRARTFLNILGNQPLKPKDSEDLGLVTREEELRTELLTLERRIQGEWSKPQAERSQELIDQMRSSLKAKQGEYQPLLTQLQSSSPEYAASVSVKPYSLAEAQSMLSTQAPDVTLIMYFVGEEETHVFVVGAETFYVQVVPVGREALQHQISSLLVQMKEGTSLPDAWQVPAKTLYDWLIAPVRGALPSMDAAHPPRIGIVPHGVLHHVPFGLLHDGHSSLIDGYTLFYEPSVSSMEAIFGKRHSRANTLFALANPDFPGFPSLPNARAEVQALAGLYEGGAYLSTEATETLFKEEAGHYGLVHIAAHSDYVPTNPLFSAILLQPDDANDGRLETHEVFDLDLPQTDLVVLSACETHSGELSAGDEIVGLERAFIRAGSPSLLTTLWVVDDVTAKAPMTRFYTHLRNGIPKAEALRLVQLEIREQHQYPYHWAGFILVGDPGPAIQGQTGATTVATDSVPDTTREGNQRNDYGCPGPALFIAGAGATVLLPCSRVLKKNRRG